MVHKFTEINYRAENRVNTSKIFKWTAQTRIVLVLNLTEISRLRNNEVLVWRYQNGGYFWRKFLHKKPKGLNGIKLDIDEFDQRMVFIPKKLVEAHEMLKSLNHWNT